jgi:hypothetical protein
MRKTKLDSNAVFRPLQPFSVGSEIYNLTTRLHGDHPAVAERPEFWIAADAADDEVAARAGDTTWGEVNAALRADRAANPEPSRPASVVMICTRTLTAAGHEWQAGDRALSTHPACHEQPDCWRPLAEVFPEAAA